MTDTDSDSDTESEKMSSLFCCRHADYSPVAFAMSKGPHRHRVKVLLEMGGGQLDYPVQTDPDDRRVRLADPDAVVIEEKADVFHYQYVLDCVKEDRLLPTLREYRLNKPSRFLDDDDPFMVLCGKMTWGELRRRKRRQQQQQQHDHGGAVANNTDDDNDGETCSDLEDDDDVVTFSSRHVLRLASRRPYTNGERQEILDYLVKRKAYSDLKGRALWERMVRHKVCHGLRTWQSMKEHFLKQMVPQLERFSLKRKEIGKLRRALAGDIVNDSGSDEVEKEQEERRPDTVRERENESRGAGPSTSDDARDLTLEPSERSVEETAEEGALQNANGNEANDEEVDADATTDEDGSSQTYATLPSDDGSDAMAKKKRKLYSAHKEAYANFTPSTSTPKRVTRTSTSSSSTAGAPTTKSTAPAALIESSQDNESPIRPFSSPERQSERKKNGANLSEKRTTRQIANDCSSATANISQSKPSATSISDKSTTSSPSTIRATLKSIQRQRFEENISETDSESSHPPSTTNGGAKSSQESVLPGTPPLERAKRLRTKDRQDQIATPSPSTSLQKRPRRGKRPTPDPAPSPTPSTSRQKRLRQAAHSSPSPPSPLISKRKRPQQARLASSKSSTALTLPQPPKRPPTKGKPYTFEEDNKLAQYVKKEQLLPAIGGVAMWKCIERKKILPNRTWQSIKERFRKNILPTYGRRFFQTDDDGAVESDDSPASDAVADVADDDLETTLKQRREALGSRLYTQKEDELILGFIVKNRRFSEVGGLAMWEMMERTGVVPGRSAQSMKERFRKTILKNLNLNVYANSKEARKGFRN